MKIYPLNLSASFCGEPSVSLNTFENRGQLFSGSLIYSPVTGNAYTYPWIFVGFGYSTPFIRIEAIVNGNYVTPYSAQFVEGKVPLNGWVSTDPIYDPPPTFTITKNYPISSIFFTPDPDNPYTNKGYITDKDVFLTLDEENNTTATMYSSSVNIPNVKILRLTGNTKNIDLSYFTSLCTFYISGLINEATESLNLKRNKLLKNIAFYNIKEEAIGNNFKGKEINSLEIGSPLTTIPPLDSANTYIGVISSDSPVVYNIKGPIKESLSLTLEGTANYIVSGGDFKTLSIQNNYSFSSKVKDLSISENNNLLSFSCQLQELTALNILNCSSLSSINLNTPNVSSIQLSESIFKFESNSSYNPAIIDDIYSSIDSNTSLNYKSIQKENKVINYPGGLYYPGRTTNSDNSFCSLLRKDYYLPFGHDMNSNSYVVNRPAGYIPSSSHCDNIIITSPISARNGNAQVDWWGNYYDYYTVRHTQLSGTYTKTSEIYNNRDVWKNTNNYFILFNESLSGWTVVGPLSTSSVIWLSATDSKSFFGDPPAMGWYGPAYTIGGFQGGSSKNPATFGTVFGQSTTVTSTKNLMFSSFNTGLDYSGQGYLNQGQLRYFGNPSTGINNEFYLRKYNFLNKMVLANSSNPFSSGKAYLISPIHFLYNFHYPPGWNNFTHPNNSTVRLYNSDGSYTTRVAISGRSVVGDMCLGILNSDVPSPFTYVHLATSYYCGNITNLNELSSFVFGPLQSGRFGSIPFQFSSNSTNFCYLLYQAPRYNPYDQANPWGYYDRVYSINKSLLVSESIAGGDSGCGMWVLSGNNTVLLGMLYTPNGGPSCYGEGGVLTITRAMTALSQAYSKPYYYPSLAIFDT